MSFFRGSETVTIQRRSATSTDGYGNKSYSTTNIVVKNCMIGFGESSEPVDAAADPVNTSLTIYMPNGTQIQPGDVFLIRGTKFVKDGEQQDWVAPFDFNVGVVVKVRKRNG